MAQIAESAPSSQAKEARSTPWGFDPRGPRYATPAARSPGRRLRVLINVLLALVLLALLVVVVLPNVLTPHYYTKKMADADNMRGLMKSYVAGVADGKMPPSGDLASGPQFWIALYTTDGAGEPSGVFLGSGDGGFIVSPKDPVMKEDEVIAALQVATHPAVFIDGRTICSYNGPTPATMRAQSTRSGKIIGSTGDRDGVPLFDRGANVLYGNIKTEFLEWDEIGVIADAVTPAVPTGAWLTTLPLPFALDGARVVN